MRSSFTRCSISCDVHKYAMAPKGASVIMYRSKVRLQDLHATGHFAQLIRSLFFLRRDALRLSESTSLRSSLAGLVVCMRRRPWPVLGASDSAAIMSTHDTNPLMTHPSILSHLAPEPSSPAPTPPCSTSASTATPPSAPTLSAPRKHSSAASAPTSPSCMSSETRS